mmetsp:Transcript_83164/g.231420  ORF Transcript_83164/g.231420 Transcript_83164/m.231420 type:complete len:348 (-) Transcript_83164:168-1211(-)
MPRLQRFSTVWQGRSVSGGHFRRRPLRPQDWLDFLGMLVHHRGLSRWRQLREGDPQRPTALLAGLLALRASVGAVGGDEGEVHRLKPPVVTTPAPPSPNSLIARVLLVKLWRWWRVRRPRLSLKVRTVPCEHDLVAPTAVLAGERRLVLWVGLNYLVDLAELWLVKLWPLDHLRGCTTDGQDVHLGKPGTARRQTVPVVQLELGSGVGGWRGLRPSQCEVVAAVQNPHGVRWRLQRLCHGDALLLLLPRQDPDRRCAVPPCVGGAICVEGAHIPSRAPSKQQGEQLHAAQPAVECLRNQGQLPALRQDLLPHQVDAAREHRGVHQVDHPPWALEGFPTPLNLRHRNI